MVWGSGFEGNFTKISQRQNSSGYLRIGPVRANSRLKMFLPLKKETGRNKLSIISLTSHNADENVFLKCNTQNGLTNQLTSISNNLLKKKALLHCHGEAFFFLFFLRYLYTSTGLVTWIQCEWTRILLSLKKRVLRLESRQTRVSGFSKVRGEGERKPLGPGCNYILTSGKYFFFKRTGRVLY